MVASTVCAGVWGVAICGIVTWHFYLPLEMTIARGHESSRRLRGFLFFVRWTRMRHTKCSKVDFFCVIGDFAHSDFAGRTCVLLEASTMCGFDGE